MKELSLNILDIYNNSLKAQASLITVSVDIDERDNLLKIEIADNGIGMDQEFLEKVCDPFTTTRKTRHVGLGLPFFKQSALETGGTFEIKSKKGEGTVVRADFVLNSIDRMPLGNMAETVATMIMPLEESRDLVFKQSFNDKSFSLDSREIREILGEAVPLNDAAVINWVSETVNEGYTEIGCDLKKY